MDHTKIVRAGLGYPRQELSNGGLGIAVCSPKGFRELIYCWLILEEQSSCKTFA